MRFLLAYLPLGLWAAAVLLVGSLDLGTTPLPSGSDKAAHFVMYGVGGGLAALGHRWSGVGPPWLGLVAVAIVAAADELRQARLPHRHGDPMDFVADLAGAIVVFGLVRVWHNRGGR